MVGFVICVTLSFVYGWKLTLVVIGYVPIIVVTNMIISKVSSHSILSPINSEQHQHTCTPSSKSG